MWGIRSNEVERNLRNIRNIGFEVTDACNLECHYCAFGKLYSSDGSTKRGTRMMQVKTVLAVLDYFESIWRTTPPDAAGHRVVISFYGGEPLLNFNLIERTVSAVKSLCSGPDRLPVSFAFSITTNAVLLDKYVDYLAENDFSVLVSLDGDRVANGHRVDHKGAESFDQVLANVKMAAQKYPGWFESSVNFNSVLHNLNSVEGARNYIFNEFGKYPMVNEMSPVNVNPFHYEEFLSMRQSMEESIASSESPQNLARDMFFSDPGTNELVRWLDCCSGNVFKDYRNLLFESTPVPCSGTCRPFSRKFFVTVDGKILQCERIPHRFELGKVGAAGVVLDSVDVAVKFNSWIGRISPSCEKCASLLTCSRCILGMDSLFDEKPWCSSAMDEDTYRMWVEKRKRHLMANPQLYSRIINDLVLE